MTEKALQKRCIQYARQECANDCDGQCIPQDCPCFAYECHGWVCTYFLNAVLPMNPGLNALVRAKMEHAAEQKGKMEKPCALCHQPFYPVSNRSRYCEKCRILMKRKKNAERQRRRYWKTEQKPHALDHEKPL
ncbi:MAG: cysteine-rich VLP protein [Clostridia bacterium]|nr:cysteine-rich VLP protein [Clostridia bacterium]